MDPVPDFFQRDDLSARVAQVKWLQTNLQLDDDFFAKVLKTESSVVVTWRSGDACPDEFCHKTLGQLWTMFMHLFSLLNFDYSQVRALLNTASPQATSPAMQQPWNGNSMLGYLEQHGDVGIRDVNHWITSFRFTDRYSAKHMAGQWAASYTAQQ